MTAVHKEMSVNHLPVLTWHRLGVNSAALSVPMPGESRALVDDRLQRGITKEICDGDPEKLLADLAGPIRREAVIAGKQAAFQAQEFAGGLGPDFDSFMSAAEVPLTIYRVPAGSKCEAPSFLMRDLSCGADLAERQLIYAEAGSESTWILADFSGKADQGLCAVSTRVFLEAGAKVRLYKVGLLGSGFLQLDDTGALLSDDASFDFVRLLLGGKAIYTGCLASLNGSGSDFYGETAFLGAGSQHVDINDVAVQRGRRTRSKMLVKGVLRDRAEKIYRGTIDFRRGSAGSAGDEQEDILLLNDDVINRSVPIVLCEEEDVDGRHGATIGNLAPEVLFYLTSRGISPEEARKMLVRARLMGTAAGIPDAEIRARISDYIMEAF